MGTTAKTANQIAESDNAADEFFARYRSRNDVRLVVRERYALHLWEATREAQAHKYDHKRRVTAAANKKAAAARLARTGQLRPRTPHPEGMPHTALNPVDAIQRKRNTEAARQFFAHSWSPRRIERVKKEAAVSWVHASRMSTFLTARIDPISAEEYAAITTRHPAARRAARAAEASRLYRRGQIHTVGEMTLDRAYEVADAVIKNREAGTGPTYR